jgi:hypothetical protein
MTETGPRGLSVGCLASLGALLALGAVGAVLWLTVLGGSDDPASSPTGTALAPTGTAAAPTGTADGSGCADVTEEFQRSGATGVEYVRSVCWDSDGQLRAEIELAADINLESAPMQGLCAALTEFITASGRPWQGFSAYSSSPLTPGQPLLARVQPDEPCHRPSQS